MTGRGGGARCLASAGVLGVVLAAFAGVPMRLGGGRTPPFVDAAGYNVLFAIHEWLGLAAAALLIVAALGTARRALVRGTRAFAALGFVLAFVAHAGLAPMAAMTFVVGGSGAWLERSNESGDAIELLPVVVAFVLAVANCEFDAALHVARGGLEVLGCVGGSAILAIASIVDGVRRRSQARLDAVLRLAGVVLSVAIVFGSMGFGIDFEFADADELLVTRGWFVLGVLSVVVAVARESGYGLIPRSGWHSRVVTGAVGLALTSATSFALVFVELGWRGLPARYFDHLARFDGAYLVASLAAVTASLAAVVVIGDVVWAVFRPTSTPPEKVDPSIFA